MRTPPIKYKKHSKESPLQILLIPYTDFPNLHLDSQSQVQVQNVVYATNGMYFPDSYSWRPKGVKASFLVHRSDFYQEGK